MDRDRSLVSKWTATGKWNLVFIGNEGVAGNGMIETVGLIWKCTAN